jgi:hypothetical protein
MKQFMGCGKENECSRIPLLSIPISRARVKKKLMFSIKRKAGDPFL